MIVTTSGTRNARGPWMAGTPAGVKPAAAAVTPTVHSPRFRSALATTTRGCSRARVVSTGEPSSSRVSVSERSRYSVPSRADQISTSA